MQFELSLRTILVEYERDVMTIADGTAVFGFVGIAKFCCFVFSKMQQIRKMGRLNEGISVRVTSFVN